jgi:thioredoxin-dependent peroxiredoxin
MSNTKIIFGGNSVSLVGKELKVGSKAPDFTVIDGSFKPVTLSDFSGKVKLISIFPSIDTGVCSMQNRKFNQEAANFGKEVAFIAISADLPFALKRFCGAEGINNLVTLSDHKEMSFANNYGFHISELRLLARGVVILDSEDIVKYIEILPEAGNEPNYEMAIKKLKELV